MAYKISGTASHDCTVYVINTASNLVDKVQSVSAGAYEIELLTSQNNHLMAEPDDGNLTPIAYTNVDAEYYDYIQPTFGLSLKEVKRHGSFTSGVVFSKPSGTTLEGRNLSSALGWANAFCVFDKNVLIGNKVQIDWQGDSGSGDDGDFKAVIADGFYDRNNGSDFPQNLTTGWASKGGGDLVTMYDNVVSSFGRNTLDTGVLTLAGSTQSYVTVFVTVATGSGRYAWYTLYSMKVLSPSNAVITEATMDASIVWPEGQTGGDANYEYGRLGTIDTIIAQ